MKFGVFVSNWEPFSHSPQIYEKIAMRAEELGFEFFLVSHHYVRPTIGNAGSLTAKNHATLDTWSLLSYLAGKTGKIKLGSCVTPITLFNPFLLAKIASTVDVLSGGRVILGAGAGYEKREFEIYGTWDPEPRTRVSKVEESLTLMKRLWSEEKVDHKGRFFEASEVVNEPKPVQAMIPLWFGAMSPSMLKLTAKMGDVWIPSLPLGATLPFYEKKSTMLKSFCNDAGRQVKLGLVGHIVSEGFQSPFETIGTLNSCVKRLEQYRSFGMEYLASVFLPVNDTLGLMERFAREIVPSFS